MSKKDKSFNYWSLTYQGKYERTRKMIPLVIVIAVLAPFFTSAAYDSTGVGIVFDVILIVTLILQLSYTKKKAMAESDDFTDGSDDDDD
ncbi:hypothetical protein [Catenisphaera adipataccumulans]|jgi:uncharacterized membrane protein (DUF4010 family)|uniref:Uncharacterized membrane protein (DUF4010 family) n=1 Tax=Catenisphaera adipataccumulans TaxID=700500 RepID=A0A7W8CYY5_9FIRM|nr:hypothetical protein [Catenisphaera adipataccumulans]MBB5182540.1 uncharacterized membrane protein (DUF4010 family) [Catenisphaera adipataccumulans]